MRRISGHVLLLLALVASSLALSPMDPAPSASVAAGADGWLDDDDWDDGLDSIFESLGLLYDPESDPGSLYQIADEINAPTRWLTGRGVDIALIDTGVVEVEGLANTDLIIGPDFSFEDASAAHRGLDTNGHGTHLAGIIAGTDQAWGEGDRRREPGRNLGVAPGARLISVKVGTADGGVDVSQVIAALNWVVDHRTDGDLDIRIVNLAFGTDAVQDYRIDPLSHAVQRAWDAGIVVVAAAGNDGTASLRNPATNPSVIAVGASDLGRGQAGFSNGGGARGVDVLAPGVSIVSLRSPGSYSDAENDAGRVGEEYVRGSGTSQAAAVVTGAVALLLEQRPWLEPDEVKHLIVRSARGHVLDIGRALWSWRTGSGQDWDGTDGSGSIDAARGSVRVVFGDDVLSSDVDVFGNDWSGDGWETDSWSGLEWDGSWDVDLWGELPAWTGASFDGVEWSGNEWSGNEWSGNEWSGSSWSGSSWSGNEWSSVGSG